MLSQSAEILSVASRAVASFVNIVFALFLVVLVGPAFFFCVQLFCGVLRLLLVDSIGNDLQEYLRCGFSVGECNLSQ